MKTSCLLIIFLSFSISLFAQKEADIWYFGSDNAGLDFNSGSPVVLTIGKIGNIEGGAVISDDNGSLLFYTDGETVWNKNHDTLSNGKELHGNNLAAQPALIIPEPGSSNIYYIFTTDMYTSNGFCYSIVDMDLDNGLGEVTTKNIQLFSLSTEKITASRHTNGTDIWVIAHERNSDAFYSYLVSQTGVNHIPVISNTGQIHSQSEGYMKATSEGTRLAVALTDTIEIFQFDKNTGIVSDPISISVPGYTYGVEFSPDGNKLYFTCYQVKTSQTIINEVYQVNLTAGSEDDIKNSIIPVFHEENIYILTALQLGPDEKIYSSTAHNHYLDVIASPNLAGNACQYIDSALYLNGRINNFGLPNFFPDFLMKGFTIKNKCAHDSTFFSLTNTENVISVLWNFDDPTSLSNTSDKLNTAHYYKDPGVYDVSIKVTYFNNVSRTFRNSITIEASPQFSLGNDTSICVGEKIILNLPEDGSIYLWNNGSANKNFTITSADTFWVKATLGVCEKRDSIIVAPTSVPSPFLGNDTTLCSEDTLKLYVPGKNVTYKWNDGSMDAHLSIFTSGSYAIEETNKCGTGSDVINVNFIDCCSPSVPNLLTSNQDGLNEVLIISCIEDGNWKLKIFNRWGENIYSANDYRNDFNASSLDEGVYFYSLSKSGRKEIKGWIQVVK